MEPSRPVVMKFGGTSVQDAAAIRRLIEAVAGQPGPRVVVVSALAGVTDALSDLADGKIRGSAGGELMHRLMERHIAIVRELVAPQRQRTLIERLGDRFEQVAQRLAAFDRPAGAGAQREARDAILAFGELASSQIVAAVLAAAGLPSSWVDARDVIVTDATFGAARPQPATIRGTARRYLLPLVGAGRIPVLGGFVGASTAGATTTLGRGGSDYTASLVGAALDAREVQIWTDVDGVYTADPRIVEAPALVPFLSFHEAYELARFGAKVLHWGTLEPAASGNIPVRVLNAQGRNAAGTAIAARGGRKGQPVAGLAHQAGVTIVDARSRGVVGSLQFLQVAMEWLERNGQAVNVVSLSPARMVVVAGDGAVAEHIAVAMRDIATVTVTTNVGLVAVVGDGVVSNAAAWRIVGAARATAGVDAIVTAQSGDALVCLTSRQTAPRLLTQLHGTFFGDGRAPRRPRVRTAEEKGETTTGSLQAGAGS